MTKILGIQIDDLLMDDACKIAEDALISKKRIKIFTPNPEILLRARKDEDFKKIVQGGDLLIPDGFGVVLVSKFFKNHLKCRVTGIDMMLKICELAEKHQKSVFFLGGEDGVAKKASENIKKSFPKLEISGFSKDEISCYDIIEKTKPNALFVALGAPRQEIWISENIGKFPSVNIAIGVGGAFDIISGKIKRAPKIFQKMHLEWFWRFLMEPKKRFKRMINAVIIFPAVAIFEKLK